MMDPERREWDKAYAKRNGRFVEEQYVEDEDEQDVGDLRVAIAWILFVAIAFVVGGLAWIVLAPKVWPL